MPSGLSSEYNVKLKDSGYKKRNEVLGMVSSVTPCQFCRYRVLVMCTLPEISLLEACVMWVSWQGREILCMVILLDLDWRVPCWPLAQRTMIMQLQQLDLTTGWN
jgi:hypothetical protein